LAEHEADPIIANVYRQMSDIEKSHAAAFAKKRKSKFGRNEPTFVESKTLNFIGKVFGYDYVLGSMMDIEKSISTALVKTRINESRKSLVLSQINVKILQAILENEGMLQATTFQI
jgi:hypothetical protein